MRARSSGCFGRVAESHPQAVAHLLRAIDFDLSPTREVALIGAGADGDLDELSAVVRSAYRPHLVLAGGPQGSSRPELLAGRTALDARPAAYVCESFSCRMPVSDPAELAAQLAGEVGAEAGGPARPAGGG